jgi:CRP-like cAMP-binding protein
MAGDNSPASTTDALLDQVLSSRAFSRIPREAISKIVARIDMLPTNAGEAIIRRGEVGDSFYIIRAGRCRVAGYTSVEEDTVELATLGPGDSFGEEALIRGTPRNATIEMLSDGYIARLNKEDFVELVQNTLLRSVAPDEAKKMIEGGAEFIDVRGGGEYTHFSIRGSRNIPFDFLRKARRSLDPRKMHITCSDQELEAAVAAFLLAQAGFETCYLACSVGEYLSTTGEFADDNTKMLGEHGERIIDLPDEYVQSSGAKVTTDERSFAAAPPPAAKPNVAAVGDSQSLRAEFNQALAEQRMQFEQALTALRAEFSHLLDGSSKFIIQKMMEKLRALEQKIEDGNRK